MDELIHADFPYNNDVQVIDSLDRVRVDVAPNTEIGLREIRVFSMFLRHNAFQSSLTTLLPSQSITQIILYFNLNEGYDPIIYDFSYNGAFLDMDTQEPGTVWEWNTAIAMLDEHKCKEN